MRTLAAVLLVSLLPRVALADPPTPLPLTPVPAGHDVIEAIKKGQPAPYDGQVFDQSTSIRWANYLMQCDSRLKLDVAYQYKLDMADLELEKTKFALEKQQYIVVTADLQDRLRDAEDEAANPPFYKTMWFGVIVGVVATIGVTAGTAALVNAASK